MGDRVDEILPSADVQARGQCRAGGSATPVPPAEPQGIDVAHGRPHVYGDAPTGPLLMATVIA